VFVTCAAGAGGGVFGLLEPAIAGCAAVIERMASHAVELAASRLDEGAHLVLETFNVLSKHRVYARNMTAP
jgi:hypothetical protein